MGHTGRAGGLLGALADLMPASVSLSVNWAQGDLHSFLMTILDPKSAPQAALSLFPFRDLNSSHEGVPLKREARARNLAWDSTSKRWGRPGQASTSLHHPAPLPSGSLGPRLELLLGKVFYSFWAPQPSRPWAWEGSDLEDTVCHPLRAMAAPAPF